MGGRCHGRPARVGLRYGEGHAALGLPSFMRGLPPAPVPLLEAAGRHGGRGWLDDPVPRTAVRTLRFLLS